MLEVRISSQIMSLGSGREGDIAVQLNTDLKEQVGILCQW